MTDRIEIKPSEATLGARVRGVDLRSLDEASFARIEDAWHQHGVLAFPEQTLDEDAQIAFSERFGALERLPTTGLEGDRAEIFLVGNVGPDGSLDVEDGLRALTMKGNELWHSDSSFKRIPAKASPLAAKQVPSEGGETEFADMRAAYDALDDEMKDWLGGKTAIHSYRYSHGLIGGLDHLTEEELDAMPPVPHPVVRTHGPSGRKSLFIGWHASHIVGEDVEESRELLRSLLEAACEPPRVYRHEWRPGDLVIWDNRSVLHRGRPWPADQRRVMTRTTVAGSDSENEWRL